MESRRIARYTLAKITNYLAKQSSKTGAEQVANPDARQVNLEHVLPESNPSTWRTDFSQGVNPADYIYRIGNLTLLLVKPNKVAADKSFGEKKKIALNASGLKINEFFRHLSKWGDREIEQRQGELAKGAVNSIV